MPNKYTLKYESYFDLPIGIYFDLLSKIDKCENDLQKAQLLVKTFYQLTDSDGDDLSIESFKDLLSGCPDPKKDHQVDIKTETWLGKACKTLSIAGETFEFSPDLTKFCLAQYIDFQMALPKVETNPEVLLSTILIPKGYKYNDGYDANQHIEWIKNNVSIGISNKVINFFIKRYLVSINNTGSSSIAQLKTMKFLVRDTKKKAAIGEAIKANQEIVKLTKYILGFAS